jgi:hypothetical protein
VGMCAYTSWIFVQTGHLTTGAASFGILEIRGGEGRVGRWATGRSLLANRRSCACTWSVLGCRPGKTLPMLIVPAYAPTGADGAAERKGGAVVVAAPKKPIHPALLELGEERARSVQNRVADSITRFAGSMTFAYLHIAWFSSWIALGIERYPYGLLTMIVSLEAIFLSTFVMISQNRQDDARRHLADQEWLMVQSEEQQNVELIELSNQILELTKAIHQLTLAHTASVDRPTSDST